jgi:class 3 adenylate cyclase
MEVPETRYAKTADGVHIAYQVLGDGPPDMVFSFGWVNNVELMWESDLAARFLRRLATFSRVINFDKRGSGLSDRVPEKDLPNLETRMDDVRAVMDAVGSDRAVIFGVSEAGTFGCLFAATYPERTVALIICQSSPRSAWAPDWPTGITPEEQATWVAQLERGWGSLDFTRTELAEWVAPSAADDEEFVEWANRFWRLSASPGAVASMARMEFETDVRPVLPMIRVPTLVIARDGYQPEAGLYFARYIPGAQLAMFPGADAAPITGDQGGILDAAERFVRDLQAQEAEFDRVLATVLFTDIVGSTDKAAELGDRAWRELVERHHTTVRGLLARYRGQEVDTAGDGFFATFDGPARGVRCAQQIVEAVRSHGLEVRAGIHTGEVQMINDKIGGLGVLIGARIGAQAGPSEVLASQTVRDLTAGSGLAFEDAGEHELKGVPDRWRLYRVIG